MPLSPDYVVSVGTGKGEDPALVHVPEGERGNVGEAIARFVDWAIRDAARAGGRPLNATSRDKLCPGCYMAVMVNALIKLARDNGQSFAYIERYFNNALTELACHGQTSADARAAALEARLESFQEAMAQTHHASVGPPTARYEGFLDLADPEGLRSTDELGTDPQGCTVCAVPQMPEAYKNLSPSDAIAALKGTWPDNSAAS